MATDRPAVPHGALSSGQAKVLLALCGGAKSYDDIIAATGLSRSGVHHALSVLRREGVVTWADGKQNTTRPSYAVVPPVTRSA